MTASAPEPLTGAEVSALRAVAEGATPGPWEMDDTGWGVLNDEQRICSTGHSRNADHIATFDPPTILHLLAVAEDHARLVGAVAAVEALADEWVSRAEHPDYSAAMFVMRAHANRLRAALNTTATEEGA